MSLPSRCHQRVLIVEPAAVEAHVFSAFGGLPLLGTLNLGTLLARAGFEVRVVSETLLRRSLESSDLDADFLLLSCLTPTVERGYDLATLFKRRNPAGKVLMGGPLVSFMQEEALQYADWVVTGEGENVVVDLLQHGSEARVVHGTPVENLDSLPLIDRTLLVNHEKLPVQPYMFSRGCPFGCTFCSVTAMFGRHYRAMSPERVLAEIAHADRHPDAFFYDDNFAANKKHTHEVLDGILRMKRPPFQWSAQVRADVTRDPDLLQKMARAGCGRVYVGFESVDDRALREMNKGQTAQEVREAVRRLHEHGIRIHSMFMFGADADRPESAAATSCFVRENRIDSVQYMIFTPFPGTETYRRMEGEGRLLHRVWRYYDAMHVVFRPQGFRPSQLQRLAVDTYGDYYNLLRALNDGLETAAAALLRLFGGAPRRLGTPGLYNAGLKVMGSRIVREWSQKNAEYLAYLRAVEA
jgi:radical SAM superfamily enzyme YgiQ (UPF0313 family)